MDSSNPNTDRKYANKDNYSKAMDYAQKEYKKGRDNIDTLEIQQKLNIGADEAKRITNRMEKEGVVYRNPENNTKDSTQSHNQPKPNGSKPNPKPTQPKSEQKRKDSSGNPFGNNGGNKNNKKK